MRTKVMVEKELADAQGHIEELGSEVQELTEQVHHMRQTIVTLQGDKSMLEGIREGLLSRVKRLEKEKASLASELDELINRLAVAA